MSQDALGRSRRVLEPIDRISEILFGLIMVLTFTGSLAVAEAGRADVRDMLIGALGCNVAWGIIDGVLYLMGCLAETGRGLLTLRAIRAAPDALAARERLAAALPPLVARLLRPEESEALWTRLKELPEPPRSARLSREDWLGALGVFLLVTVSLLPVAVPFVVFSDAALALRVSNGIALVLLFLLGRELGRCSGRVPWRMGLGLVVLGAALVAMTMALGG